MSATTQQDTLRAIRNRRIADGVKAVATGWRTVEHGVGPLLDLALRLWIARVFFVSAVLKLANWDNALYLAANEYPVSWLDPVAAAILGVAVEFLGAILLASGLAARFAAVALAGLTLVIQFSYRELDLNLLWTALLGWIAVHGAGRLSLDALLGRGLADSALPLAGPVTRSLAQVTRVVAPWYRLFMRLWFAAALVLGAGAAATSPLFPIASAAALTNGGSIALALFLALGLGTRYAALAVLLLALGLRGMGAGEEFACWVAGLGLLATHGAGRISLDALLRRMLVERVPELRGESSLDLERLPRVVIVGAGFGGLNCAAGLARAPVSVTLIDRRNYHLFQPLLYQVATAALSPGDIATPIRGLFRDHPNVRVLLGEVSGVDTEHQAVLIGDKRVPYDHLVLATGATHSYFGRDDWAPYAPGLKRVEDATEIRGRLLSAFEQAEASDDAAEREALLTILVVGGGPTGVELAGAIAELARYGMEKEFRRFDPAQARVVLIQAGPRLLPTFPEALSEETRRSLAALGVVVRLDSRVETIDADGVTVSGERIAARTVLWAAGVVASAASRWLQADADNAGRVKVREDLSVPGLNNVFVVGDTAAARAWNGNPVPGLAPAAKQGGRYVADVIAARVGGRRVPPPFVYRHLGSLATIGRKRAVADFGFFRARGALAWWFWGAVHVAFLVDLRSRISVVLDWFWAYLTLRSGTRLITGAQAAPTQEHIAPQQLKRAAVS
jgi:NADH dehydrogenase/putative oxidoreductase